MFQELLSGWSETNDKSKKWFIAEQIWVIDSGFLSLSFSHSESWLGLSWLKKAELFVVTRVSLIISFADIISILVEEIVMSITDKALCVVYNERKYISRVS